MCIKKKIEITPLLLVNYRPVIIFSQISRIFEAFVLNGIQPLVNNSKFTVEQQDFCPDRSTNAIVLLCNFI